MKRVIAFLLGLCMMLALTPVTAEETAAECAGGWYFVYGGVTFGELQLNEDGTYRLALYSQNAEDTGSWTTADGKVTLNSQENGATSYLFDGTKLLPDGFELSFEILREPGRITDGQLNEYVQNRTLPEGMSEEEMQEIIGNVYAVSEAEAQEANTYGDFAGVWVNDRNGYLTIWGKNIAAAFPIDGELVTGFYGNPGEWTVEGNAMVNSDGTIMVMKTDGTLLCSEATGTYAFRKVFSPSGPATRAEAEAFAGDWIGTGILVTDTSGVRIFTPVAGYDLKITGEQIFTLFQDETNVYPYSVIRETGKLVCAPDESTVYEFVLYQDDTIRWQLADNIILVFRKAEANQVASLYVVSGPSYVPAGSETGYTVAELEGGRTYTWSAEGEGVTIDPDTGVLTVAEGTAAGTPFTVTATPTNGEEPATLNGTVCSGVLGEETFEAVSMPYSRGFTIPAITSWGTPVKTEDKANGTIRYQYGAEAFTFEETCSFIALDFFPDAGAYYEQISENLKSKESYPDLAERTAEINGNPVYMLCFTADGTEGTAATAGFIYVVREDTVLVMTLLSNDSRENPSRITLNDLETIAGQIAFDPAKAPLRKEDGELSITSRGNPQGVSAGKTAAFTAAFANAAAVKREKADAVTWSVAVAETGEQPEGIAINEKGVLTVGKDLTAAVNLVVTASSAKFGTTATYPITAVPVIRKLTAAPADVTLYADSDNSAVIQVTAEPEIVPAGLEWTLRPDSIAEVITGEDGTATLKPLAPGKGTLSVKEPGGKSAIVRVNVLQPVTGVELKTAGKAVPGGVVMVTAAVRPKNAGNKKTEWSVDVGDDIATINDRGKVRINKSTPAGTVITVTCTATGAKEPVVQTIQIEVAEK